MTATRIEPAKASSLFTVAVQANWNGTDVTDANGGVFNAPAQWIGNVLLINWVFQFVALTGTGTSGTFVLKVPDLDWVPDQYCGFFAQRGASAAALFPALLTATGGKHFETTMPLYQGRTTSLTAHISAQTLNY